jgi:hypothetical protein
MNISDLVAIDMHVHIEADGHGHTDMPDDFREAARKHFGTCGPRSCSVPTTP